MMVPDTGVVHREVAFGVAQRGSWVFSAWWHPAVLAVSGAVLSPASQRPSASSTASWDSNIRKYRPRRATSSLWVPCSTTRPSSSM